MIPRQLTAPGQLTDPGVHFASVHGLIPVTVHELFVALGQLRETGYLLYCTTPGNQPCQGNVSPCERNAKVALGQEWSCTCSLLIFWNKYSNKKFQKALEIGKHI